MTLVVNLYGGPGTGKSTTAAGVFSELKQCDVNCEYVHEFAKELTWEDRQKTLAFQPYVISKQMWMVERVMNAVDVVITDSPILLGWHYGRLGKTLPESFYTFIRDMHKSWNTFDILLLRNTSFHAYNPKGRNQTQQEAEKIDSALVGLLVTTSTDYQSVVMGSHTIPTIVNWIKRKLDGSWGKFDYDL